MLDLGSGIGSVGMITAWRLPFAKLVTVEAQEKSVQLAKKSRHFNELEDRYDIRFGDFRDLSWRQEGEFFDLVMGSPPYFPLSDGIVAEHPQKAACRFELRGDISDYCKTASSVLAPGGMFFTVFSKGKEERVLQAAHIAELSVLRHQDVIFKEGESPLIALYQMGRRQDFPERLLEKIPKEGVKNSPIIIRAEDGSIHPEYSVLKLSIGFPP